MHQVRNSRSARRRAFTAAASLLALAAGATATSAAAQADPSGQAGSAVEEVVVTGSRIARSTFTAPSPVTVLGAQDLQKLNVTNVGGLVGQLPAFRPSNNPATNGFGSFNVGAQIVNLRGLGTTRNLILVDGRRFAPTTREWSVDLNLIPSILVQRTEIVTGGASAAYGSDAIAGVVNVILDKSLNGFKGQADYGVANEGDGKDYHLAGAFGTDFLGSGHAVIGAEYDNQKGIGNCFTRSWCRPGQVVSNVPAGANGLPANVRSDTNAGFYINSAGVISPANNPSPATAAIRNMFGTGGITFDASGNPIPFHPGSPAFGLTQIGGDVTPTYLDTNIMVPVERFTTFGHADWRFNDRLQGFVEGSYGYVTGSVLQSSYFTSGAGTTGIPIFRDNAYLPDQLRAIVGPAPVASGTRPASSAAAFVLGRTLDDLARGLSTSTANVYRVTAGLNGKFNDNWSWDAYYQYGHTNRKQTVENNLVVGDPAVLNDPTRGISDPASFARFEWASDAVVDPATGNVVCRATISPNAALRQAAAGCAPLNLFGPNQYSQAAKDYIYNTLVEDISISEHVASGNLHGDLAQLWAGPLSVALGGEFRRDSIDVTHDPLSNLYAYFQNFGSDYNGVTKVIEGYVEGELPLAHDMVFAKNLTLNAAARRTHYDISGFGSYLRTEATNKFDATTWKASLVWDPTDWLRLRATRSRDIRAPNFAELFLASASNFTPLINRFRGGAAENPSQVSGGSPFLKPEKADTITLGGVFSPRWGFSDGLRLSFDYYRIRVKDFINSPGTSQTIVDRCYAGNAVACSLITFGPGQTLVEVRNISANLEELKTKGLDLEAEYRLPLSRVASSAPGDVTFRVLATKVFEDAQTALGQTIDRAGQTGSLLSAGLPDWTVNAYLTYDNGPLSATVQGRFISSGVYDAQRIGPDQDGYSLTDPNSISDNHVGSAFYVNLFASYNLINSSGRRLQVFGSINNLFDRAPPFAPELQYPTNPVYFDQVGRYYRVGLRFAY